MKCWTVVLWYLHNGIDSIVYIYQFSITNISLWKNALWKFFEIFLTIFSLENELNLLQKNLTIYILEKRPFHSTVFIHKVLRFLRLHSGTCFLRSLVELYETRISKIKVVLQFCLTNFIDFKKIFLTFLRITRNKITKLVYNQF